jgi:hypothetical protein
MVISLAFDFAPFTFFFHGRSKGQTKDRHLHFRGHAQYTGGAVHETAKMNQEPA